MAESQENHLENAANNKVTEVNGETTQTDKRIALITGITGQVRKKGKFGKNSFLLRKKCLK